MEKRQLIVWLRAEMRLATGREYRIDWDALDVASLRELQRFILDSAAEKRNAAQRAQRIPWRRP